MTTLRLRLDSTDVLTVGCHGKAYPMPAEGSPWHERYSVTVSVLKDLPSRLMAEHIWFSNWDGWVAHDREQTPQSSVSRAMPGERVTERRLQRSALFAAARLDYVRPGPHHVEIRNESTRNTRGSSRL